MSAQRSILDLVVYCIGLLTVYFTSTWYHYEQNLEKKVKIRVLDHMAIFLLIGGTYTPLLSEYFKHPLYTPFVLMLWTLIVVSIVAKYKYPNRFKVFFIINYVLLGSLVVLILNPLLQYMPREVFLDVLYGGIAYIVGIFFYINKKVRYTHFVWHCFVLIASFFHYRAIYHAVLLQF
jgi:hemolysin III